MIDPKFAALKGWHPRVVGLDLSLTSTGASDGQSVQAFQTGPHRPVEDRLSELMRSVKGLVLGPTRWTDGFEAGRPADLVVIEGSAFSRTGPGHEELAALRLMVRTWLFQRRIPFAVVGPSTLKKYTTGYGKATKAEMEFALKNRHGLDIGHVTLKAGRADMVDAYALAALGADRIGYPFPRTGGDDPHWDSLNAVTWPFLACDDQDIADTTDN